MFDFADMFIAFSFGVLTGVLALYIRKDGARVDVAWLAWSVLLVVNVLYLSFKYLT